MKRELFGSEVSQRSKSEFFSATDLVRAGNRWRRNHDKPAFNFTAWLKTKQTQEFMDELDLKYGKSLIKGRGKGHHTWVHPLLFIDLALAISPQLKIEVYEWLFDYLIQHRNESGDSYKSMCGVLYVRHQNQRTFQVMIKKLALRIQRYCGVSDWQQASEAQLKRRNKIHEEIALLADVMNNNDEAIRIVFGRLDEQIRSNAEEGQPLFG
jgi:hypothetical protein